jgi:hypothetical protein
MSNEDLNKFKKTLPGSFWGITTFYNPGNYKNKEDNYHIFRTNTKQQGLRLLTVECALKNKPFQLKNSDADILIQVCSDSVLWHKETLLNIALDKLPADCDKIVWLDADILFLNNNWIKETEKLLEEYIIVKPFKNALRISEKDSNNIIKTGNINLEKINSEHKEYRLYSNDIEGYVNYVSVFAWAARRQIFNDLGFYNKMIIGGGDSIMTTAFMGQEPIIHNLPETLKKDIEVWSKKIFARTKNSIAFIEGSVVHLFHGSAKNRKYITRYNILEKYAFDPTTDLKLNSDRCLEWSSNKKELHKYLNKYFYSRNESNYFIKNLYLFLRYKENREMSIDILLGKIGIRIKTISPLLYFILKNITKRNSWPLIADALIGQAGITLKKISPRAYAYLKNNLKSNKL